MPLGPILGALAGSLASAGASALAGKVFGGGSVGPNGASVSGFNGGGLSGSFRNGAATVTPSSARSGAVQSLAGSYGAYASQLGGLRSLVSPGSSALRAARLASLESSRQQAVGDLRDNLARRRVLGSSFAQDSLTRADLAYGQQADAINSDSFMQELQLTQQLTTAEAQARTSEFQTNLDELNLEANAASQLASSATTQLGDNQRVKAQLDAQAATGSGQFFGQVFQPFGSAVGKSVTNYFSPSGTANALGV